MVLVSLLLVLLAAVALVIGLLQSGLGIIYASIGCSVLAGILLAVAVVRGKPEKVPSGPMRQTAPPPPAPASQSWESPRPAPEPEREPAVVGAATSRAPDSTQQLDQASIERAVLDEDDDMPIPGYDRLRATEVLPLLANLDTDDLARIRAHESSGRNRFMVLSRIDRELEARGPADVVASDAAEASSEWDADDDWDGTAETDADTDGEESESDDDGYDAGPASVTPIAAPAVASGSILDNYEQLKVLEILPRLGNLNADELAQVRRREQAGQRRAMIINRVDRLLVDARPASSARTTRSRAATPARRGAAKREPVDKAAGRKAPAKKLAPTKSPARKVTPTKATTKSATAKSAATKVSAKKAPAKKAPAAAVRTSTPTEKRAGAVKKVAKARKATKKR